MTIESPPIPALITELARVEGVQPEQPCRGDREYQADHDAWPKAPAPPQQKHQRSNQGHVDRFREGREAEEESGNEVAAESPEKADSLGRRDLFIQPEKVRDEHQR